MKRKLRVFGDELTNVVLVGLIVNIELVKLASDVVEPGAKSTVYPALQLTFIGFVTIVAVWVLPTLRLVD